MAAGLPYICSDFPGWRKVAEESGAGICVDPNSIVDVQKAVKLLIKNRDRGQSMGRKGREYVISKCNWANEEKRLLTLYKAIGA